MNLDDPPRRATRENLLPMINVVFLLLVFFLIAARMAPPQPFAVDPPQAEATAQAQGVFNLHIAADGALGFRDAADDAAALAALQAVRAAYCDEQDCSADPPALTLRADARLPGARLAALLPRLAALGFARIELVVQQGPA